MRKNLVLLALICGLTALAGCAQTPTAAPTPKLKLPPTLTLATVAFANHQIGWAAGNGVILATKDGGLHWKVQYAGKGSFTSLEAVDSNHAFAWGGNNILLGTANGGNSWTSLALAKAVSFPSSAKGFALDSKNSLLITTGNGGHSWHQVSPAFQAASICFADPTHGYAFQDSGLILRTVNGGSAWTKVLDLSAFAANDPLNGAALACSGPDNVWALIYGGVGMTQGSYTLYHTADGGTTWQVATALSTAGGGPAPGNPLNAPQGPGNSPGPLAPVNGTVAYLLGKCEACGNGTATLGVTKDGGATWQNLPPSLTVGGGPVGMAFPTPNNGWIVATLPSGQSEILATTDAGTTWITQGTYSGGTAHVGR